MQVFKNVGLEKFIWLKALKWQLCLKRVPGESKNSFIFAYSRRSSMSELLQGNFIRWNMRAVNLRDVGFSSHAKMMSTRMQLFYSKTLVSWSILDYGVVGAPKITFKSVVWFQHLEKPKGSVRARLDLVLANANMTCGKILPRIGYFCVESASTLIWCNLGCLCKLFPMQMILGQNELTKTSNYVFLHMYCVGQLKCTYQCTLPIDSTNLIQVS